MIWPIYNGYSFAFGGSALILNLIGAEVSTASTLPTTGKLASTVYSPGRLSSNKRSSGNVALIASREIKRPKGEHLTRAKEFSANIRRIDHFSGSVANQDLIVRVAIPLCNKDCSLTPVQ